MMGKDTPFCRQFVQAGRSYQVVAITPQFRAKVVHRDEQHVGLLRPGGLAGYQNLQAQKGTEYDLFSHQDPLSG
jgi:hypothetical protein